MNNDILAIGAGRIRQQCRVCLASGLIAGVVTHLYIMTNKLPNWDDINNLYGYGGGDSFGRWMLKILRPLSGVWSVPALNGMLAILFFALSACVILETLELQSYSSAVLLPVIMLTFPSVASTMTFMFTVNTYALGLWIGCIGVWLSKKYVHGWIPGAALMLLCLAVYQSYICLFAAVLLFDLVLGIFRQKDLEAAVKRGIHYLLSLVLAMGGYLLVTPLVSGELSGYRGIDSMGRIQLTQVPHLMGRAYKRILDYFLMEPMSYVSKFGSILNWLVILAEILLFVYLLWKLEIHKKLPLLILSCSLMGLIPLALSGIYVMAPQVSQASTLMLYQYGFVYVVLLGLTEIFLNELEGRNTGWKKRAGQVLGAVFFLLVLGVGYDHYVLTNNAYFRMEIAYGRIHSFYERLYNRLEEQEGYQIGEPIAIMGDYWPEPNILSSAGFDLDRYQDMEGISMENGLFTTGVRRQFMRTYLGIDYEEVSDEWQQEYIKTEEFKNKPSYPEQDCVWKKDGIWVIKVAN